MIENKDSISNLSNCGVTSCYIHIPFCTSICSYCDFCKVFYNEEMVIPYLQILASEICMRYKGERLSTLYVGGGTPSSLSFDELSILFSILKKLNIDKYTEFTFECNIENIDKEKLQLLWENGVNRLSIGVQTFHSSYLHYLNRKHTKEEVYQKIELAKKIGFTNISIDLMYGFKGETLKEVLEDVNSFLQLDIPHLSIYSLILEPHTTLFMQGEEEISEDLEADMYFKICEKLKKMGYEHYEISNFCKSGYDSLHNLTYWNNEHYYGFGVGASGYIDNIRYSHTRSITQYNKGDLTLIKEVLDKNRIIENALMLGFRKIEGISKQEFYQKYKIKLEDIPSIQKLLCDGKLVQSKTHISIHPKYIYVMNEILIELIDSKEGIK